MTISLQPAAERTRLDVAIDAMHQVLTLLLELMRQEAEVLAAPGTAHIEKILEEKQRLLETVNELEQTRQSACVESGLDPNPAQMLHQIIAAGAGTPSREKWDDALGLLESCQQQNLTNGAILQLRQRFTIGALGVLRGAETDGVYSETGSVDSYESRNSRFLSA